MLFVRCVLVCVGLIYSVRLENATETYIEESSVESSTITIFEEVVVTTEQTFSSILPSCDVNGSCNTNATTLMPPLKPNTNPSTRNDVVKYKISTKRECSCDLQHQFCDINCCCDRDCSYENKLVFKTCDDDEDFIPDTKFCKYMQYIYQNKTLYEWEITQNSLFCIVKSNLPPQYFSQKKQNVITAKEALLHKNNIYSWPLNEINEIKEAKIDFQLNFTYGDSLWFLRNRKELLALEFLNSFITEVCHIKSRIRFLKNYKTDCIHTGIITSNTNLNAKSYYANLTVISLPRLLYNYSDKLHDCPKNVCLPIEAKLCDINLDNCYIATETSLDIEPLCTFNIKDGKYICKNLVTRVKYHIYHNGTFGIKKVDLFMNIKNVTFNIHDNHKHHKQSFEVKFYWQNYTLNYSDFCSGHPGYRFGKPILIANLVTTQNVTTNSTVNHTNIGIIRDSTHYINNFMVFPSNVKGLCELTNNIFSPIEFGYNMITKCVIRENIKIPSKNFTAKGACQLVQNAILKYWSFQFFSSNVSIINKTVGKFGNANVNEIDDWSSIIYERSPQLVLNSTTGKFINNNTTVVCYNITTSIKTDLFHAREQYKGLHNQEKIVGTFIDFTNILNIDCKILNGFLHLEVPIKSAVMFYDITTKHKLKFVDPPSLDIKLPFDFFYPFVKVGNSAEKLDHHINELYYTLICICIFATNI